MPQKKLQVTVLPSFVKLRTTPEMKTLAKRLAEIKRSTTGIEKIEGILRSQELDEATLEQMLDNLTIFADYNAQKADDLIAMLKGTKKKVDGYIKRLK